jgi:hypothetical protein
MARLICRRDRETTPRELHHGFTVAVLDSVFKAFKLFSTDQRFPAITSAQRSLSQPGIYLQFSGAVVVTLEPVFSSFSRSSLGLTSRIAASVKAFGLLPP